MEGSNPYLGHLEISKEHLSKPGLGLRGMRNSNRSFLDVTLSVYITKYIFSN